MIITKVLYIISSITLFAGVIKCYIVDGIFSECLEIFGLLVRVFKGTGKTFEFAFVLEFLLIIQILILLIMSFAAVIQALSSRPSIVLAIVLFATSIVSAVFVLFIGGFDTSPTFTILAPIVMLVTAIISKPFYAVYDSAKKRSEEESK